jgi:hypothetical protein
MFVQLPLFLQIAKQRCGVVSPAFTSDLSLREIGLVGEIFHKLAAARMGRKTAILSAVNGGMRRE